MAEPAVTHGVRGRWPSQIGRRQLRRARPRRPRWWSPQDRPSRSSRRCGQVQDEAVGLLLHAADDHPGFPEVALGVARRMGQRHEHLPGLAVALPDVVLDYGVLTVKPVLIPQPLEDALCRVPLFPGTPEIVLQDPVDNPAGPNRPAFCAPCPGADRTPGLLPAYSFHPPSPPFGPADIRPLCTSIAPSMGSATTL